MADRILTIGQAVDLSAIVKAATGGQKVARLIDGGRVIEGVARSIGDEHGNFASEKDDVRDCYLRVTATFEYFWPVSELLTEVREGTFITNYQ